MTFQEIILNLQKYWSGKGCVIMQPYDIEVGAGTFNPSTFLKVLGNKLGSVLMSSLRGDQLTGVMAKIQTGFSTTISFRLLLSLHQTIPRLCI